MNKTAQSAAMKVELSDIEHLILIRRRQGWTQKMAVALMAKEFGVEVTVRTLRAWEQGKNAPNKFALAALRKFIRNHAG